MKKVHLFLLLSLVREVSTSFKTRDQYEKARLYINTRTRTATAGCGCRVQLRYHQLQGSCPAHQQSGQRFFLCHPPQKGAPHFMVATTKNNEDFVVATSCTIVMSLRGSRRRDGWKDRVLFFCHYSVQCRHCLLEFVSNPWDFI